MLNLYLKSPNSDRPTPILLVIRLSGKGIKCSTGQSILPMHWDSDRQMATRQAAGHTEINAMLDKIKADTIRIYRTYQLNNTIPTPAQLRQGIRHQATNDHQHIMPFFRLYARQQSDTCQASTITNTQSTISHINALQQQSGLPLTFASIASNGFYRQMLQYFASHNLTNGTIGKHIKTFKRFLNWAAANGHNQHIGQHRFALPKSEHDIIFLTQDELTAIATLPLPPSFGRGDRGEAVRDAFLLACYTGLRFSDLAGLTHAQLHVVDSQPSFIRKRIQKIDSYLSVPLSPLAQAIIDRYQWTQPLPPNSTTNAIIKKLGLLAGITSPTAKTSYYGQNRTIATVPKYQLMSAHTARRTFITLSYSKGMKLEHIMAIVGIRNHRTIQRYLAIPTQEINTDLRQKWATI